MRKFNLPKKERKLWLEALESGEYKQTTNDLVKHDSYCCLGVYGRVVGLSNSDMRHKSLPYQLDEDFKEKYPKCLLSNGDRSFGMKLAIMNDTGKSFKQIAKYIRKNTIGV